VSGLGLLRRHGEPRCSYLGGLLLGSLLLGSWRLLHWCSPQLFALFLFVPSVVLVVMFLSFLMTVDDCLLHSRCVSFSEDQ
jgi:membrane glycosyltransferase